MNKKIIGMLSFLPLISFIIGYVGLFAANVVMGMKGAPDGLLATVLIITMVFMLIALISLFAIMIWFIILTCKNPNLSGGKKAMWIVLLYCFHITTFPIYYFKQIKNQE